MGLKRNGCVEDDDMSMLPCPMLVSEVVEGLVFVSGPQPPHRPILSASSVPHKLPFSKVAGNISSSQANVHENFTCIIMLLFSGTIGETERAKFINRHHWIDNLRTELLWSSTDNFTISNFGGQLSFLCVLLTNSEALLDRTCLYLNLLLNWPYDPTPYPLDFINCSEILKLLGSSEQNKKARS